LTLVFVDFETFYDKKAGYDLRCLSMVEYVRDPRFSVFGAGVAVDDGPVVWCHKEDLEAIDWAAATVVGHNLKFDGSVLARLGFPAPLQYIDTKALVRATLGKQVEDYALATIARHLGLPDKGQLKIEGLAALTPEQEEELAEYCKHDTWLCREIYNRCIGLFPEAQLPHLDWTIRSFIYPRLAIATGVLETAVAEEQSRKLRVFEEIGIDKAVFSSQKKFADLLSAKGYAVPTKKSARTGKDIPALAKGDTAFFDLQKSSDKVLQALCAARTEAKSTIMETRCAKLGAVGVTGPWPFDVEFSGAAQTHRHSGGGGAAGNPQNFPRCQDEKEHKLGHDCKARLRGAVRAPEGHKLVVGDFAAIEMRLVAYLANDPALTKAIGLLKDVYCEFASAFYQRVITKKDKAERWFGKTAILGLGYGMGAMKFQHTVRVQTGQQISDNDAERAVKLYRTRYWRVPQLWAFLDAAIPRMARGESGPLGSLPVRLEQGKIRLPSGLLIQFPGLRMKGMGRWGKPEWVYDIWGKKNTKEESRIYGGKVLENISQALAGELAKGVNQAFLPVLTGVCHDEVMLCVPESIAGQTKKALESAMSVAPAWMPKLKLACEVGVGMNWQDAKV
jgi:hypothetical protein